MKVLQIFRLGVQQVFRYWRMWLLLYFSTLGMALFVALPVKSYLESKAGHSLMIKDLVSGFDYTFFNDFLNNYGDGIAAIMQQSVLVILLFLLLMIFWIGGILSVYQSQFAFFDRNIFWTSSAAYFGRMLLMTLLFFVVHLLILIAFLFIYSVVAKGFSPNHLDNDTVIFTTWKWLLPLYILTSAFFFMWHDYAKIILVNNNDQWIFKSIGQAFNFIRKNFAKAYGLYLLNVSCLIAVFIINYFITDNLSTTNTVTIFLGFFLVQLFIIVRLGLRLLNWSSATQFFIKKSKI